jgi:enoyl-[acyl-carrier-protein] reductase (NADH)
MNVLDRILAGVTDNASISSGTSQMLHNLAEQVRVTATNPTAVDQIADLIHNNAAKITAAILANTPTVLVNLHPDHADVLATRADVGAAHPDSTSAAP